MIKKKLFCMLLFIAVCFSMRTAFCAVNAENTDTEGSTEGTAYAVLTESGDLVFFRSYESYDVGANKTVSDLSGNTYTGTLYIDIENVTEQFLIGSDRQKVKRVYVAREQMIRPKSMYKWFYDCNNLISFDSDGFDTSRVKNMSYLFLACNQLSTISVAEFDTSTVTDMSYMFDSCSSLTELDVRSFDTSCVENMMYMFYGCSSLTSLDVSKFDTGKVTNMFGMFCHCSSLNSLDLSNFDTSNVKEMGGMFLGCNSLINLDVRSFDTSNVTDMSELFAYCSSLQTIDISRFDTSSVKDMSAMFQECSSFSRIELYVFDTSRVENMSGMFYGCNSLTFIDISKFDTSTVTNMSGMFQGCSSLSILDLSNFDTRNVTNMSCMFIGCSSLINLDLSNFDTRNVTSMSGMFEDCICMKKLNISSFDTSNVSNMGGMFQGCSSLSVLDISNFDTSNVTNMSGIFLGCSSMTTLDISGFDTSRIVRGNNPMFGNCTSLVSIKLGKRIVVWFDSDALPKEATWTHGNLVKTSAELVAEYPSNASEWAGEWRMQMLPVTITNATHQLRGILVEWDRVEGATGYIVYRRAMKSGDTNWSTFARWNNTTDLWFLDTKVYEGTKYQYGIKAYYGGDPSTTRWLSPVGPMSNTVIYTKKPSAPTKTTTNNINNGIEINWDEVGGATGYIIYRRAWSTTTGGWTEFQRWNNTKFTTWTDTKVYAGTKYQYGIKAYNGDDPKNMAYVGSVGPLSTNVRITTRKIRTLTLSGNSIIVNWEASNVFTGYQLEFEVTDYYFSNYNTKTVNISDKAVNSYTITDVDHRTRYYIKVRSYHVFNGITYYGSWSDIEDIVVQ